MTDYVSTFGKGGFNDQVDIDSLVREIGLDREELEWRKDFVDFDEQDVARLEALRPLFEDNTEEIAEKFYENLTQYDETVEVIGRSEKNVEALKQTQKAYFTTLASGEYDQQYFANRARIGKLHDVIQMPMKQYIGQYGVYYDLILPLLAERARKNLRTRLAGVLDEALREASPDSAAVLEAIEPIIGDEIDELRADITAVLRIINLDMQVVADTYLHSYNLRLDTQVQQYEQLAREVKDDLESPLAELETAAAGVSESSKAISTLADEQSARIRSVAGEVSNMSATVEEIASSATEVEQNSQRANSLAEDGQSAATDAMDVMDDVGEAVAEVSTDVDELQSRVGEIDSVVEVINDIAEQTNILALNASIEAARAGEAGEGFAVVADEVKSLAGDSQERAQEIEDLVSAIERDTAQTVESLDETTEEIERGVDRVSEAMELLDDITEAVQETAHGIREVSDATDEQAASSEEVASMLDELVDRAETVATEAEEIATANEQQAATITEISEAVKRLNT